MINILNRIYKNSFKDFEKYLKNSIEKNKKEFIITVNPETLIMSEKNIKIREILNNKKYILVPDGISIVKACRKYGINIKQRITGIDITKFLLEEVNIQKKSLYLFGAKKEVIKSFAEKIKKEYKNINLLGYTDGYVKDKDKVFKRIMLLKPDVCLVALGIPAQEEMIHKYIGGFKKGIFIGVGGTFDVLSGHKKRAPQIFIKCNFEWLYRILKEPKRIKRFIKYNIKFYMKIKKIKVDN